MAKDPICGMDVAEEGARFFLHFDHETLYFCSEQCKTHFAESAGMIKPSSNKGLVRRFLERLAQGSQSSFGGTKPKCH